MRVLAIETSARQGSVAALAGTRLLQEATTDPATRTARSLAPTIRQVMSDVGWKTADLELIAVTAGPGSFTGLRIGVTTAKTLAYASGAALRGVNTLDVIADQVPPTDRIVFAILDAQRQQLFCGRYRRESNQLQRLQPTAIVDRGAWVKQLAAGDVVTGPGLQPLTGSLPPDVTVVDEANWNPRAANLGRIAQEQLAADGPHDLWTFAPNYYRRSAAEEKHATKR